MFDYFKYRIKLAKLRRQESNLSKPYQKLIESYRIQKKSRADIDQLRSEEYSELQPILEEIAVLGTSFLRGKAKKHLIPLPDIDSPMMWEECSFSNGKVLTDLGIATVKSFLRNERREKLKIFLQVLAGITGIVGALIGLLSIIKK